MIPIESVVTFVLASALLGAAPGPDNIFVLTQSVLFGRRSGLMVTLGLCTGLIVHTSAVALGVAVLFQTSAIAFTALKFAGALYLLYLAWRAFTATEAHGTKNNPTRRSGGALYMRGVIMNVTNPKISIFFLAFLPQFTSPENGSLALQITILGALFITVTLIIFGAIAILAGTLGDLFNRRHNVQVYLNRVAGTVFAGLALKLLTTEVNS